ncbi:MAG: type II toxin-antitoxin system HicB family antitoxin [Thermotogaceae bacterium]|nr:type II toxin-antitoxin system HicB family antitoxin [Thermotogaceae bacterium]
MKKAFTAIIEYDPETKQYIGIVPNVSGVHTVGNTIEEVRKNLKEVLELVLEETKEEIENTEFVALEMIEVK